MSIYLILNIILININYTVTNLFLIFWKAYNSSKTNFDISYVKYRSLKSLFLLSLIAIYLTFYIFITVINYNINSCFITLKIYDRFKKNVDIYYVEYVSLTLKCYFYIILSRVLYDG